MKEKDYLEILSDIGLDPFFLKRREFLKLWGGGIFVFFTTGDAGEMLQQAQRGGMGRELPKGLALSFLKI